MAFVGAFALFALPTHAEPYTAPDLFGDTAEIATPASPQKITPKPPVPVTVIPPVSIMGDQPAIKHSASAPAPTKDIAPIVAAPPTKKMGDIPGLAPTDLLEHPADHTDDKARAILSARPRTAKVYEGPDDTITRAPRDNNTRLGKPKMLVYSRDPATGEFRQVDPNKRPPQIRATTPPPNPDNMRSLAARVPPLDADLTENLLNLGETSYKSDTPVAPPLPRLMGSTPVNTAQSVRILFRPGLTDLNDQIRLDLDDRVVKTLAAATTARAEIQAFASEVGGAPGSDRRISLARALAVREYLKSQGVNPGRLDIRAMGKNTQTSPTDRVDVRVLR